MRDRVVQATLVSVIEPIFELGFAKHLYGFRTGRGAVPALARVERQLRDGHHWMVDPDIKVYFDNLPKARLLDQIR